MYKLFPRIEQLLTRIAHFELNICKNVNKRTLTTMEMGVVQPLCTNMNPGPLQTKNVLFLHITYIFVLRRQ